MNMQKASVLKSIKGALIHQYKVCENAFVCVCLCFARESICVIAPVLRLCSPITVVAEFVVAGEGD